MSIASLHAPFHLPTASARFFAGLALALFALVAPMAPAAAQEALERVEIVSGDKTHVIQAEVMRTDADRARGLMFRRHLPEDRGMLFDFKTERPVAMWMKNTYLPLDMIFIAADGRIVNIAENTEPMSERTIPSAGPVLSVLEVNAGVSAKLGIKAGDRIRHPLFKR